ncbi:MAG: hypothetical protein JXA87_04745 [Thermoleophilia bacterium]|nr:hypothetical protein [Thermoleophilia bacterium]
MLKRFDIPGRKGPTKVVLYPRGHRRVFDLPYDTDDSADIKILRTHPLLVESRAPTRAPAPAPTAADKPQPQKEV